MQRLSLSGILPVLVLMIGFASPVMTQSRATYTNPIFDRDFPDPTVIQGHDGLYYAYATNSGVNGKTVHIQVARSRDLITWESVADALPQVPTWAKRDFWAPHVSYLPNQKKYVMYYSGHNEEVDGKCIGVAVSDGPTGPFVDRGEALMCGPGYVHIDPMLFEDPKSGKLFLYWGSGHDPIRVREMTPDGMNFAAGSEAKSILFPNRERKYESLVEGTWVVYRKGWYFLMYSGDNCCGEQANYAVLVARSRNPLGPFERMGDARGTGNSVLLELNEAWFAPGHNSVLTDKKGQDWMFYHAIPGDRSSYGRRMLMDRIDYKNGWPVMAGPTSTPTRVPALK